MEEISEFVRLYPMETQNAMSNQLVVAGGGPGSIMRKLLVIPLIYGLHNPPLTSKPSDVVTRLVSPRSIPIEREGISVEGKCCSCTL